MALSSNERGVVSVLEDAIMLCGNCSSSTVWLEKAMLTGATNNTISRNIEKYVAVSILYVGLCSPSQYSSLIL